MRKNRKNQGSTLQNFLKQHSFFRDNSFRGEDKLYMFQEHSGIMHPVDANILEAFQRDPSRSFSTTELVREVFPKDYAELRDRITSADRKTQRKGYNTKATLHRNLLYHINKLVQQGLLEVGGVRGKGEKLFKLSMQEGELVVQDKGRRIVITKQTSMTTPVDGYEKRGIVRKYEPSTWLNKHDAIMLEGLSFDTPDALLQRLQQVLPVVSDAIAINRMEHVMGKASPEEREALLKRLAHDAHDYDVALSLLFHVQAVEDDESILEPLRQVLGEMPGHLNFIFHTTPRLLTRKEGFFRELYRLFHDERRKLTLKNSSIAPLPIFFGRAGPYSFTPEDWEHYKERLRGTVDGCVVGQTSLAVDIEKYLGAGGTITGLRELAERAANAFFEAEEQRRKHFGERPVLPLPSLDAAKEFHKVGRDYLRFWNDWEEADKYPLLELLQSVKDRLAEFSSMQETIYKSCGLPIRFRIGLSTSFARFDQDFFSERRYRQTAVSNVKQLQTTEMKRYLEIRERLYQLFDGADRLRFFIARGVSVEETARIVRYLLSAYSLPSVTLDFRGKSGEMKLTTFMES